ncbi:MAG: SAM-dependent methyltransferase [Geodermatophilaceae bacterium]
MTRGRKPSGRILFVGAGPGDPDLLTIRASRALTSAELIVVDPDVGAKPSLPWPEPPRCDPPWASPPRWPRRCLAEARSGRTVVPIGQR